MADFRPLRASAALLILALVAGPTPAAAEEPFTSFHAAMRSPGSSAIATNAAS